MPQTFAPPAPRYYSNPAHFHDSVPLSHFSNSMTGRPVPTTRSISLPVIRVQNASGTGRDGTQSMSRSSRASVQQQKHHVDIQTARLETLAALTASRHDSAMARHTSAPSTAHMQRHHTPSSSLPSRNSYKQCGSRTRSRSSLKVPPPAYQPGNTGNIIYLENPDKQGLLPPPDIVFEKRVIPRRESLTQWKVEREEAKVDFNGMRRADTKERVRRANELEQEKEKELLLMGKGTGMKKEKERGCLSGLFALLPRRKA
ncbi:uncharacterized protein K460DRAFT_362927 [Cucurbitaria berberidis CBS 394.84]|uniref:Uncharacterized protein n=1 Tax=Cucurbitaria berberidis CBS 394.84 TaxID=1168544 RepID=A0A9P4GVK8_9PLEO|nr:uncharacterized protein K460DRAFT_362927 [Cucurbitaria berberidis CBS 394.84]KAF1852160.1 hypothetical protein K460DRAFT_362927 [Cucurbitaria berberidis CBS 394.84]